MNFYRWGFAIIGVAASLALSGPGWAKGLVVITGETLAPYLEAQEAFEQATAQEVISFNLKGSVEEGKRVLGTLEDKKVDAVVLLGISAVRAAQQTTPAVPVVYTMVIEPQTLPVAKKVAGLVMTVDLDSQFGLMRKLLPKARTVGVLYHPKDSELLMQAATAAAEKENLKLVAAPLKDPKAALQALQTLEQRGIDVLWSVPDKIAAHPETFSAANRFALQRKLPLIGISEYQVRAGAYAAFSVDYQDMGRQTAELVDRMLKRQLPEVSTLEFPRLIITFINLNTGKVLGLPETPSVPNIRLVR